MLLKVNTLQYTCTEKYRNLMSRYLLVSCTTLNTRRWPRILGEEPNINDMSNPKEISGSQWDGKRYTYLARLCDVYRHCFSRKHEPLNRLFCDLYSISFLCIPRINFSRRLFICAKIINTSVLCYCQKYQISVTKYVNFVAPLKKRKANFFTNVGLTFIFSTWMT